MVVLKFPLIPNCDGSNETGHKKSLIQLLSGFEYHGSPVPASTVVQNLTSFAGFHPKILNQL